MCGKTTAMFGKLFLSSSF